MNAELIALACLGAIVTMSNALSSQEGRAGMLKHALHDSAWLGLLLSLAALSFHLQGLATLTR